jgi:hypothetical protein
MDRKQRRVRETSGGLFLMVVGFLIMLLNCIAATSELTVSILGLGLCVVGGSVYR